MKVILLPEIYDHTFKYKFRRGQKSMGNKLIKKKKYSKGNFITAQ